MAGIYPLHGNLTAVCFFTSVKMAEMKFEPKLNTLRPDSCKTFQRTDKEPKKVKFTKQK